MKLNILILFCIFISSCSTRHFIELTENKIKQINIPKNYTVLYCNCDINPHLLTIISKLKARRIKVIMIDDYSKFDQIKSDKNIVLYGYSKKINGSTKNYIVTDLVSRSEKTKCGKRCTVSRSWNELVIKNVNTSGDSIHNNVLIYKIDEKTELLLAVNSGDKYSLNLSPNSKKGNKQSEEYAYIFKSRP